MKVLAVDMDEVICPMIRSLNKHYARTRASPSPPTLPSSYNFAQHYRISDKESKLLVQSFYQSHEHAQMLPIEGSQEALHNLSNHFTLKIVTGRQIYATEATYTYLDTHFNGLFSDVIFTNSFSLFGDEISKHQVCTDINASFIIDDNVDICSSVLHIGTNPLLFGDYPWNDTINDDIPRMRSWSNVNSFFNTIK